MKKVLLIFLMLILPWQAIASTERTLAHVIGSGTHDASFVAKHMTDHAAHVLHHHDDEGGDSDVTAKDTHQDNSQKSVQHLADYEHGTTFTILLPTLVHLPMLSLPRIAPASSANTFTDRTTTPLLRPPRASA